MRGSSPLTTQRSIYVYSGSQGIYLLYI